MGTTPLFLGKPRIGQAQLVPDFSTRFRRLFIAGADGSLLTQVHIASTDASANNVQFAIGKKVTDATAMGSGAFVDGGGGSDTITRSSGSFVTDGWRVGDRIVVVSATTLGNDFTAILTGVSATTLTFATSTVASAEAFASDTAIYRVLHTWQIAVPANAGSSTTAAIAGLDSTKSPSIPTSPDQNLPLGPLDVLFAGATSALGTGETMDVSAIGADY